MAENGPGLFLTHYILKLLKSKKKRGRKVRPLLHSCRLCIVVNQKPLVHRSKRGRRRASVIPLSAGYKKRLSVSLFYFSSSDDLIDEYLKKRWEVDRMIGFVNISS